MNSPEFKLFFSKYLPQAVLPDRRVLSGAILEREAAKVIARTRQETNGKLATYSEDGWTNIARTHVDTSVISVEATVSVPSAYFRNFSSDLTVSSPTHT